MNQPDFLQSWIHKPRKGLITDVDGTISPIVSVPDAAQVTPRSRELLQDLQPYLDLVAVISGRAAVDVQTRVGVAGVVYVGNHGLERWHDGRVIVPPEVKAYRPALESVLNALQPHAESGMLLEDKGVTLSVHYRNTDDPPAVANRLRPVIHRIGEQYGVRIFEGRMVFEVRPPLDTNKGSAFRALAQEYRLDAALYLGDDTTDVDALKAARALREAGACRAYGIGVKAQETPASVLANADLVVEGVSGVEDFLSSLLIALKQSLS